MLGSLIFLAAVASVHALLAFGALQHNRRYDAARKD